MSVLSLVYGRVARLRRSWYEQRPHARRRLDRPVISVGNLVVGGSGKTPVVAAIARVLRDMGERPAVLSRGYARKKAADGVVVVSDGERVLEPVERSGDEPQMLARALPGTPILVSPDRYLAGRLAESRFGCTVHILDDGFQHLQLARTIDVLLVSPGDLAERVLPSGRLREGLDAARGADALLVSGTADDVGRVSSALNVATAFRVETRFDALRPLGEGEAPSAGWRTRPGGRRHCPARAVLPRPTRSGMERRRDSRISRSSLVHDEGSGEHQQRRAGGARQDRGDDGEGCGEGGAAGLVGRSSDAGRDRARRHVQVVAARPPAPSLWRGSRLRAFGAMARQGREVPTRAGADPFRCRLHPSAADDGGPRAAAAGSAAPCTSLTAFIVASR